MAKSLPTEESLGLSPTEDELSTAVVLPDDDDVSIEDDPPEEPAAPRTADPPPADKAAEPPKPADDTKTVDLRALQEARAEAREARQRATILEQRWNDFLAGQGQGPGTVPAAEPEPPKWSENPVEAGQWTQDQLIAMREERQQEQQRQQQAFQAQEQFRNIIETANAQFVEREATDPTIRQAYDAVKASYAAELKHLGYAPAQAAQEMARIEAQGIQYAITQGIHVADYVVGLAKARGWQPTVATAPAKKTDLAAVAAAQQRHQSLSDAPGGEVVPPLDAKALARMSDKEFKAWMSKKGNEAKFDEMMGA